MDCLLGSVHLGLPLICPGLDDPRGPGWVKFFDGVLILSLQIVERGMWEYLFARLPVL